MQGEGTPRSLKARIVRGTVIVIVVGLMAKMLGFAEKQVLAYYFGTGPTADAYFVATGVCFSLYVVTRELVESALIPHFVTERSRGRSERARSMCVRAFTAALLVGCCGGLLLASFSSAVSRFVAPGLEPTTTAKLADLLRRGAAALPLLCASSVLYAVLNGLGRFGLSASSDALSKTTLVVACALAGLSGSPEAVLALGVTLAAAARLLPLPSVLSWMRQQRTGAPPAGANGTSKGLSLLLPLGLGVVVSQASDVAQTYFTSYLPEGSIAARTYASKLVDLPIVLLPYALSIVSFPALSELAGMGKHKDFFRTLRTLVVGNAIVFLPVGVVMITHSEHIVRLVLGRGALAHDAIDATATALRYYALGLPAFAFDALLVTAFYAQRRYWTPFVIGAACVTLKLAIMAAYGSTHGMPAIALALVVSKSVKVLALGALLGLGAGVRLPRMVIELVGHVLPSVVLGAAAAWLLNVYFPLDADARVNLWYVVAVVVRSLVLLVVGVLTLGLLPTSSGRLLRELLTPALRRA